MTIECAHSIFRRVYEAVPQKTAPGAPYPELAQRIAQGRLSICVGAGLSKAEPTGLPLGSELAAGLLETLAALTNAVLPCNPESLLGVADGYEPLIGLGAIQGAALKQADFLGAKPTFAHRAIAELTRETELVLLSLNWDTCIERSSEGLTPRVDAISDIQGLQDYQGPAILKIHGCATRPASLVITSEQLSKPAFWVNHAVGGQLAANTLVFVGMSDVPDYARPHVKEVVAAVGNANRLFVAAPGIVPKWKTSGWAELIPDLPQQNRLDTTADAFADALLRSYINLALAAMRASASAISLNLRNRLDELLAWMLEADAVQIGRWLRRLATVWPRPLPYLSSSQLAQNLLALAMEGLRPTEAFASESEVMKMGARTVLSIVSNGRPASLVAVDAARRLELLRNQGVVTGLVEVMSSGHMGPLPSLRLVGDLAGGAKPASILDAGRGEGVSYRSAAQVLEGP
jgi:hypothetical protein